jgi:predicted phosphodiesterase
MKYYLDIVSDTHNGHKDIHIPAPDLVPGDVWIFLHAGDYTYYGREEETEKFVEWVRHLPHQYKVVIDGNHECMHDREWVNNQRAALQTQIDEEWCEPIRNVLLKRRKAIKHVDPELAFGYYANFLNDEATTIQGLKIYGNPRSLEFFDWAFPLKREGTEEYWRNCIPKDADVVLVHGPPKWLGDRCPDMKHRDKMVFVGDEGLRTVLEEVKPAVCAYGHIHEGRGVEMLGNTVCVNASFMDGDYKPVNLFTRLVLSEDKKLLKVEDVSTLAY